MSYFVGIDGGGTQTVAVLTDAAGMPLAQAEGPSGRINVLEPAAGAALLAELTQEVARRAGLTRQLSSLCCALSGAGRPAEREALELALLQTGVAQTVVIVPDAEAALQDAFGAGPGLLLISGTGSIAWGRAESGELARCGGWGYLLGDEGSGYAIGLAALRAALRAHDGRAGDTQLLPLVLQHMEIEQPEALIRRAAEASRADIAALAPVVIGAAATDPMAAGIVENATRELAQHVAALHARLGPWTATVPIAFSGGLIAPGRPLRTLLESALTDWTLDIALLDRAVNAALGAATLARFAVAQ
ncbi:MAG: N-acetylglucosamine kinase [Longimicrobiales bacterium]